MARIMAGTSATGFQFPTSNLSPSDFHNEVICCFVDRINCQCGQMPVSKFRHTDYFACGADEGYSALGPVSEPALAQGGSALDSECARKHRAAAPMEIGWLVT